MRQSLALLVLGLTACGSGSVLPDAPGLTTPDAGAPVVPDARVSAGTGADAALGDAGAPLPGFGTLSGMCGVLAVADLTGAAPELVRATLTFDRRYNDPDDRALLTAGGRHMIEVGNAGGSSLYSEVFAYEELARCELAGFLKGETEIVYDQQGKITDLEVVIDDHKIGVSVTRAQTFPLGNPYPLADATTLITRKLNDIKVSTADVSAADRWDKQILAILAYDDQAADTMAMAWSMLDDATRGDTLVLITTTGGDDTFIYTNQ